MTVYKVGPQNGQHHENNDPDSFVTSVYILGTMLFYSTQKER